ncbi:MAG: hypothetical protein JST58_02190 [Bacteroidetes bacterium]|jgi:hypothetical protein|nr:hypothetical protein [Bacteroidota bacterium]
MTENKIANSLERLGYTTLWLDYGVLSIEYLDSQTQTFDKGIDSNNEHYRYNTLKHYLSSKDKLSDNEFDNYLQLVMNDSDRAMAGSAASDLFNKVSLTDSQFDKLCTAIKEFGSWTEKIITRHQLLRKLNSHNLTDAQFEECLTKGDNIVQEFIIDKLNISQLKEIEAKGNTKKIRNIASSKLKNVSETKIRR